MQVTQQEVVDMVESTDLREELKDDFYVFISTPPGMDIAGSMFGILKADAAAADRIKKAVLKLLHRQPSTAGSAPEQSSIGPRTLEDLQDRLSRSLTRVDNRVLRNVIYFHAARLQYADDAMLVELYKSVEAVPHTSTKAFLREKDGLVFNGPLSSGMRSRAGLLVTFEGAKPMLTKFTEDAKAEHDVLAHLWEEPAVANIVGPVRLLNFPRGGVSGPSVRVSHGLLMPLYAATLQQFPSPMDEDVLLACGQQIEAALHGVHKKGYGHNDIKASNVFIDSDGTCILGDFGAARQLGSTPEELTPTHWPTDLENPDISLDSTSKAIDFFLLAVTVLERAGTHQLQQGPSIRVVRKAAEQLKHPALCTFVMGLLAHQATPSDV